MLVIENCDYYRKYKKICVSSDGHSLLYISNADGLNQIYSFNLSVQKTTKITSQPQHVKDYWKSDSSGIHLFFTCDDCGNEREQLYALKKDGSVEEMIYEPESYHYISSSSMNNQIYYVSNKHQSNRFILKSLDINTKDITTLYITDEVITSLTSLSKDRLLLTIEKTNIDKILKIYNIASGEITTLHNSYGRISCLNVLSGSQVLFVGDQGGENTKIVQLNINTGDVVDIASLPNADIISYCLYKGTQTLVMETIQKGYSQLYKADMSRSTALEKLDHSQVVFQSMCFIGNDKLAAIASSPIMPPHIITLGIRLKTNSTQVDNHFISNIFDGYGYYQSFDGRGIEYSYISDDNKNKKAVIYLHGGPEHRAKREFSSLIANIADAGHSVFLPNIRGSSGYGRSFLAMDSGKQREAALKDIIYLRQHLVENLGFSEKHVSIMGHSYGGFMTLLSISHYPNLWASAIDIVGMSHISNFLRSTPKWRRPLREYKYGRLENLSQYFNNQAPLHRAENITCPLLILHGTHDARVPYQESENMYKKMAHNNPSPNFYQITNEGHFFLHRDTLKKISEISINFLTSHG
tara:strand:+ start:6677 stop:8419 length:1743 start_codon:yes stop_codon:yes gene_type:complete